MRILVIEDDASIAFAVGAALSACGHSWKRSARGVDALLQHWRYDMLLVDLGLPDIDGFELLSRLRAVSDVPVVVFAGRSAERDVVRALHLGADDYLVKPLRFGELLARIDVVVRRRTEPTDRRPRCTRVIEMGEVVVDLAARVVTRGGETVRLTRTEFDVLAVLCEHRGEVVRRERILDAVWGDSSRAVSRTLGVHLAHLRAKLRSPGLITTVRGHGYRIR